LIFALFNDDFSISLLKLVRIGAPVEVVQRQRLVPVILIFTERIRFFDRVLVVLVANVFGSQCDAIL
jgi:hypothetical protein